MSTKKRGRRKSLSWRNGKRWESRKYVGLHRDYPDLGRQMVQTGADEWEKLDKEMVKHLGEDATDKDKVVERYEQYKKKMWVHGRTPGFAWCGANRVLPSWLDLDVMRYAPWTKARLYFDWFAMRQRKALAAGKKHMCTWLDCGYAAKTKQTLTRHERTHTGEKPFECGVCGTAFAQKSNLKAHERTHSGDKPYVCSVCKTGFTQSHHLTRHMRTHTGEKPYACPTCSAAFAESGTLTRHIEARHSTARNYPCKNAGCSYAAKTADDLRKHMKHHCKH